MADPCPPGRTEYGERGPQAAAVTGFTSSNDEDYAPGNHYHITANWRLLKEAHMYALTSLFVGLHALAGVRMKP